MFLFFSSATTARQMARMDTAVGKARPPRTERASAPRPNDMTARISFLVSIVMVSFAVILWTLAQPAVNLIIFISASV